MLSAMLDFVSVSDQISEVSKSAPDTIALSNGEQQLTYCELDQKANQLAGYLGSLGVTTGGTVALCMERSFDWIIAALGIMRAGAAYVPLDASWPDARLKFALNDSRATVLVARDASLERLTSQPTLTVQGVDPQRDAESIAAASQHPRQASQPEDLAYMIYTSGSTGTPKAVEITHANLAHLTRWYREAFQVTQNDRASHLLGLAFDAAVMEVWAHLSAGATLCLAEETVRSSPELLQQWLLRERVTISLMPTVLGERLMTMEWPSATALRLLIIGGDVLQQGPAHALPFVVVNNYGPTECTVAATWSVLVPGATGAPPIGRPIAGAAVYLLDEDAQPVAEGETGEIFIGGGGVGRGYRNLPDLTLQRFLADPFASIPGARMYRTGDRGSRRPDGEIEFRGRLDRQVKIRGFRIELDEIAAHLNSHRSIKFATVVAKADEFGESQLAAFVVLKEKEAAPSAADLQQYLLQNLPDYMVPAAFYGLDEMPLSSSGKVDLAALSHSHHGHLLESAAARGPSSSTEEKVLGIVRDLLKKDSISPADNFFLAGGHSLLGTQLLVRLREQFGVTLALRQLFESPTVEGLALLVDSTLGRTWLAAVWADLLRRDEVGMDENFFQLGGETELLAAVQRRIAVQYGRQVHIHQLNATPTVRQQAELLTGRSEPAPMLPLGVIELHSKGTGNSIFWMHYLNFSIGSRVGEDQAFYVVRMMADDFPQLGDTPDLETIAACHVEKLIATQPNGPYNVGGLCLGAIVAFEVARQLRSANREVSLLMVDPPNPSKLEGGMRPKLSQPVYLLRRVARLGVKASMSKLRDRVRPQAAPSSTPDAPRTEVRMAQEMIEDAAARYQPKKYDGRVLMILASERPPHLDPLPAWQKVITNGLQIEDFQGHHEDMVKEENAKHLGDRIQAYLRSVTA